MTDLDMAKSLIMQAGVALQQIAHLLLLSNAKDKLWLLMLKDL
jgi:hypothetical protein